MLRLKTRAQFQVVLAERVIAKTAHFALHRHPLDGTGVIASGGAPAAGAADNPAAMSSQSLSSGRSSERRAAPRPLFAPAGAWLGAMVPKRWAKRSVTRHAIKRQIYDVAQALLPAHDQAAYLVRLRAGFARDQFSSASSEGLKQAVRAELVGLMAGAARGALR